ncbi:MAG: thrombospondin type 3 repeat-containing protein, partial [Pseudomonadota bacterium]
MVCGACSSCDEAGSACTAIPLDDEACGAIDCDGLDTDCRDFHDLASNRCESQGDCKDANSEDCDSYSDFDVGTPCTDSTPADCDDAQCDGAGACSQAQGVEAAGYVCALSTGLPCDRDDVCDGAAGGACPPRLAPRGTRCRDANGEPCDVAELCTGSTPDCPSDIDRDPDEDLVCGSADNCPREANPEQADTDSDGAGDVCDDDDDNDGVGDASDNCRIVASSDQSDRDNDGQGDACDPDEHSDAASDRSDAAPVDAGAGHADSAGGIPDAPTDSGIERADSALTRDALTDAPFDDGTPAGGGCACSLQAAGHRGGSSNTARVVARLPVLVLLL